MFEQTPKVPDMRAQSVVLRQLRMGIMEYISTEIILTLSMLKDNQPCASRALMRESDEVVTPR